MSLQFPGIKNAVYNAIKDDVQKIIDQERKKLLEANQKLAEINQRIQKAEDVTKRAIKFLYNNGEDEKIIAEELDIPLEKVTEIINETKFD